MFLRLALGLSFLSAVADRFGLWGPFGPPNVGWSNFARFVACTGKLNWFLPHAMIPALAALSRGAEISFGLFLLAGWQTRINAACSGILLMAFGMTATLAFGIEAPLSLSVYSAAGGSLLLATSPTFLFAVDSLRRSRSRSTAEFRSDFPAFSRYVPFRRINNLRSINDQVWFDSRPRLEPIRVHLRPRFLRSFSCRLRTVTYVPGAHLLPRNAIDGIRLRPHAWVESVRGGSP